MRKLLSNVSVLTVLIASPGALAGEQANAAAVTGESGLFSVLSGDLLTGPYAGLGFSGFSAGVFDVNASIGYNFDLEALTDTEIYLGVEAAMGVQQPTNTFGVWGYVRGGPQIAPGTWLYGRLGVGSIGGTPVYGGGFGLEHAMTPNIGVAADFFARGVVGLPIKEFGGSISAHWYFDQQTSVPDHFPGPNGSFDDLQAWIGGALGVVPGKGIAIPSINFGVNVPVNVPLIDAPTYVGGNLSVGTQMPTGILEITGGVRGGVQVTPNVDLFAQIDLGIIGGTPINGLSLGGNYRLDPDAPWAFNLQAGVRGPAGSFTELMIRGGISYDLNWGDGPAAGEIRPSNVIYDKPFR